MTPVFIALGANLADPLQQITRAVAALRQLPHCRWVACSPLYASTPMGPADQPDYVNGVAWLETALTPHQLLDATQVDQEWPVNSFGPQGRTLGTAYPGSGSAAVRKPDCRRCASDRAALRHA